MRDTAENRCMFDEENDKTFTMGSAGTWCSGKAILGPKSAKKWCYRWIGWLNGKALQKKIRKPAFLPNNGFPLLPLSLLDQFIRMSGMMWVISKMVLLCAEDFANIQTHLEIKQIVGNLYEPPGSWEFPNCSHFGRGQKKTSLAPKGSEQISVKSFGRSLFEHIWDAPKYTGFILTFPSKNCHLGGVLNGGFLLPNRRLHQTTMNHFWETTQNKFPVDSPIGQSIINATLDRISLNKARLLSCLVGGWPTPLKNDGVKVSWDDDIPNWMGRSIQIHENSMVPVSTNQMWLGNSDCNSKPLPPRLIDPKPGYIARPLGWSTVSGGANWGSNMGQPALFQTRIVLVISWIKPKFGSFDSHKSSVFGESLGFQHPSKWRMRSI